MTAGYIYALRSDGCPHVKIGRSNTLPFRRLREINRDPAYGPLGPWEIVSWIEVANCKAVETHLHRSLCAQSVGDIATCKELFRISAAEALRLLSTIDPNQIVGFKRVARMQVTPGLVDYLGLLLRFSGLEHMLSGQGAWTLSLFPSTSGGRFFTLNIGPHEVAWSPLPRRGEIGQHLLVLDQMVLDFRETRQWLQEHDGGEVFTNYASGLPRHTIIQFHGSFVQTHEFLMMPGVRRALLAYWFDMLMGLLEAGKGSVFARFHNPAAVEEILRSLRQSDRDGDPTSS